LRAIASLVQLAEDRLGFAGQSLPLGMGIPGSVSPATGLVRGANSTVLNGQPLQSDLQKLLDRPVLLQNDANCLAASEAVDGAGAGNEVVFAVILGTGVGGGIAIGGQARLGHNAMAGEWGHNPLPWPSADELQIESCWCGQRGCIETWVSGPALVRDHFRHAPASCSTAILSATDVLAAMQARDPAAQASLSRYTGRLARALAHVVNLLDPDVIVLGGGMSNVQSLYPALPELMRRHVFSDVFNTPIRPALHGDSSGVRGAAWLTRDLRNLESH
jgi:fructokinase